jgi:hypothetical protein
MRLQKIPGKPPASLSCGVSNRGTFGIGDRLVRKQRKRIGRVPDGPMAQYFRYIGTDAGLHGTQGSGIDADIHRKFLTTRSLDLAAQTTTAVLRYTEPATL